MSMAAPVAGTIMVIIAVVVIASLFYSLMFLSNVVAHTTKDVSVASELRIVNASITPTTTCYLLTFNVTNEGGSSVLIDRRTELLIIYVEAVNGTKKYLLQEYGRDWVVVNMFVGNKIIFVPQGQPIELLPGVVAEAKSCLPTDLSLNNSVVIVLSTKKGAVAEYVV